MWSPLNLFVAETLTAARSLKGNRYEEKVAVLCHFYRSSHQFSFGISPHADRGHEFVLCKHKGNRDSVKLNGTISICQESQGENNRNMKEKLTECFCETGNQHSRSF